MRFARRSTFVLVALVAVSTLAAFWYRSVNDDLTQPPVHKAAVLQGDAPVSYLKMNVRMQAKALEDLANKMVPSRFDIPSETHHRPIRVFHHTVGSVSINSRGEVRRGPISIRVSNGEIQVTAQITASMTLYKGSLRETVEGAANVTARIRLDVDADWCLVPKAAISYSWTSRPSASIAGISVSLGTKTANALDPKLREIEKRIRTELPDLVPLKETVETGWQHLFVPIALGKQGDVWLAVEPKRIYLPPPTSTDDAYIVALGVEATLRFVRGARPADLPVKPLPLLAKESIAKDGFAIEAPLEATYDSLRATALSALSDKPLLINVPGSGKATIRFDDVRIYPSAPNIVVGAKISVKTSDSFLRTEGWIYLSGTPAYDADAMRITVGNLDFSRDTDNAAIQVSTAAFRNAFRRELRRAATFDLRPKVTEMRTRAEQYMSALPEIALKDSLPGAFARNLLGNRLLASGAITKISADNLTPMQDRIVVTARVEGGIGLELVPAAVASVDIP